MLEIRNLQDLPISVYDEGLIEADDALRPFAWTEVFLTAINQEPNQIIWHIWPMTNTVILGMLDQQLPYLNLAKQVLKERNYYPVVRNIGGLAVVADEGILNFSLIIPDQLSERISIVNAYLMMVDLIRATFSDYYHPIEYVEIKRSYCPGNFDLSIAGRKFAGIAQRRIKKGIVVSIYLSVCGDQAARGQLIKAFYEAGTQGKITKVSYPQIDPKCMATLSELLETPFTVAEVLERLRLTLRQLGFSLTEKRPDQALLTDFDAVYERMQLGVARKEGK
ncbi:lipoate--protein ligase family protein [Streptococcus canis]|uniref:lipoate--protein ligase family protein n=1 Tax=Streptococcus canis TaxID=1329 RepID=UPI0012F04E31|nr:lipoate--protein ligase family protein [Streptococcus canis]QKG73564.1 lipoate--protein ligase family protein [Streptococcus canis]GFE43503.1 octanoyl-[GcvH]:protein N-octanoyltransferase [Streptococcus canis]GFE47044.1 octanoyl-[GcvH]:protein N-octanoyltransferase [Streptococcus canis]GFG45595.1 octanoyl-[GcvH]:protein N-octanoyltransferase [Streptococcus canis]